MLARRDTRREAARLRRLSPLQTLENQSQIWGILCNPCTGKEGLPPSWKLSYKTEVLRFTRESRFSFNQRIARILMCYRHRQGQVVYRRGGLHTGALTTPICRAVRSCDACAYDTPRSLIRRTASSLNSRVNFRLSMTHLRSHQNTSLGVFGTG